MCGIIDNNRLCKSEQSWISNENNNMHSILNIKYVYKIYIK